MFRRAAGGGVGGGFYFAPSVMRRYGAVAPVFNPTYDDMDKYIKKHLRLQWKCCLSTSWGVFLIYIYVFLIAYELKPNRNVLGA